MVETLFQLLKKSLQEAIDHAESLRIIRQLKPHEQRPIDLLLLVDSSEQAIEKYIEGSEVFVAKVVGVYVLMEIAPGKAESLQVSPNCRSVTL